MTLSIEQLRANFKSSDNEGQSRPNNYYPFWNIPEGSQAVLRFLPDANENNPLGFVVEKVMHNLVVNGEKKSVPCLKQYAEEGNECPVCNVSSAYYKDNDKANGKKYWRKKQHLAQVLVVEDPLPPNTETGETHEGKVRFVALGFQLFNIIKDAFESGELDEAPFAYKGGTNFIVKKTKQGDYPSYALSKFTRRSTDLTEDEIALVEDAMVDLSTLLPKNPGRAKVEGMLEAALTGASYEEKKPDTSADDEVDAPFDGGTPVAAGTPAKAEAEEEAGEFDDEADAILAQIRNRQKKKAS